METLLAEFEGLVIPNNTGGDDDASRARNLASAASSCLTDGNQPRGAANARSEDHQEIGRASCRERV